ncbi:class III lanthionine synthetase LanKC [Streptomyces sp. NPDC058629]|uniref:class III lanthionine synthetase LanKC n=1 Tax=Streptomyces sp. NPDC058629 TaxID=3346565 RepID=UPI00093B0328
MAVDWSIYALADPVFFESPEKAADQTPLVPSAFASPVPGWRRDSRRFWEVYTPHGVDAPPLPEQGWKIHISATTANAAQVLEITAGHCRSAGVAFKHLSSVQLLGAMNSKYAPRAAGGKFLALYPRDTEEFRRTAEALAEALAGQSGPYVLTDCRWGDGPVHFRYGAFREHWCWTEDGELVPAFLQADGTRVPDLRRPGFTVPEWVEPPAFLRPHIERRTAPSGAFDYDVEQALHFSNAGGVYTAVRRSDGRPVVLKEARPYAGAAPDGTDAVARLDNERRVLDRLAGLPGVPAVHGEAVLGGHRMLAVERMDGGTLQRWVALNHPMLTWRPVTEETLHAYTRRAESVHAAVTRLLARVHDRGVVFGDLHPANVLIEEDGPDAEPRVAFVDFEMGFPADQDIRPVLGHPGFTARAKTGTAVDLHALAVLRLWLYLPNTAVLGICQDKAEDLIGEAARLFGPPPDFATELRARLGAEPLPRTGTAARTTARADVRIDRAPVDWAAARASLVRGIAASATPERVDRLFPGDPRQFNVEPGSFAHGAAGVLWAMSMAGGVRDPRHEEWLLRAGRAPHLRPGFYDGAHGIAFTLHHLGHEEAAAELVERSRPDLAEVTDVSLYSGLAGIGLNLLHFAQGDSGHPAHREAGGLAARVRDAVGSPAPHGIDVAPGGAGTRGGLLRGWSGAALFLLRFYEATGDKDYLRAAVRAVHRDLDLCDASTDDVLRVKGGIRALTYLEVGSAGIGLVADLLDAHHDDERLSRALPALARAACTPYVIESQLFNGRAGLLAAVHGLRRHLTGVPGDHVQEHLANLHWNALAFDGHLVFPGTGGLRLSMDLATGSAGVLSALSSVQAGGHPVLPFLDSRVAHRRAAPEEERSHGGRGGGDS